MDHIDSQIIIRVTGRGEEQTHPGSRNTPQAQTDSSQPSSSIIPTYTHHIRIYAQFSPGFSRRIQLNEMPRGGRMFNERANVPGLRIISLVLVSLLSHEFMILWINGRLLPWTVLCSVPTGLAEYAEYMGIISRYYIQIST